MPAGKLWLPFDRVRSVEIGLLSPTLLAQAVWPSNSAAQAVRARTQPAQAVRLRPATGMPSWLVTSSRLRRSPRAAIWA